MKVQIQEVHIFIIVVFFHIRRNLMRCEDHLLVRASTCPRVTIAPGIDLIRRFGALVLRCGASEKMVLFGGLPVRIGS